MIKKERLEELIKKGEFAYFINNSKKIIKLDFNRNKYVLRDDLTLTPYKSNRYMELNNLYETKIDAELARDYKNIAMPDFSFPDWEEIQDKENCFEYYAKNGNRIQIETSLITAIYGETYVIKLFNATTEKMILNLKLTKENYQNKILPKAKKLLLGDE